MNERTKAGVLIGAIVVVILFVAFQVKNSMGGSKPVADNAPPPVQATPTPPQHVDTNPLSNSTSPVQATAGTTPPTTTSGATTDNKAAGVPTGTTDAAAGQNFKTGPVATAGGPDPFRKVLADKNKPGGTAAPQMAQQAMNNQKRPNSMGGALPPVEGFRPFSPGPVSTDAFMLKGIVADRTGPIAVVKDGDKTVYIAPGAKTSSGLMLESVGNGYAIFSDGHKNHKVLVGGGLGSGA